MSTWEQGESGIQPLCLHGCSWKRKQTVEVKLVLSQILLVCSKFPSSVADCFHQICQHFSTDLGTSFPPRISPRPKPLIIFTAGLPDEVRSFTGIMSAELLKLRV